MSGTHGTKVSDTYLNSSMTTKVEIKLARMANAGINHSSCTIEKSRNSQSKMCKINYNTGYQSSIIAYVLMLGQVSILIIFLTCVKVIYKDGDHVTNQEECFHFEDR